MVPLHPLSRGRKEESLNLAGPSASSLKEIARKALPRFALRRADIEWRCLEDVRTRLHLLRPRYIAERAFQAHMRIAAARAQPAARFVPASPPQNESIAIAPLLQLCFARQPPRVFQGAQLRFALEAGPQHGRQNAEFFVVHRNASHESDLVLAARFCLRPSYDQASPCKLASEPDLRQMNPVVVTGFITIKSEP
jgi:hypothetical protein